MGVYIKGMEMPKSCVTCRMECIVRIHDLTKRSKDCPLVSVPTPHGDLIDKAKLKESVLKWLPTDPCGIEEKEHPCGIEEKEHPYETDICVSMVLEIEEQQAVIESEE